jgi:two-component system, OmpR family, phosphate regulon response regulator PhoB
MPRILVVDDEEDLRTVLAYALTKEGHTVEAVATGAAALTRAFAWNPDVVLLDLMLPDISGTDVCRLLKQDERTKGARVIMLSAKGEEEDRILGFERGADDYVVKPFSTRELLLRISALSRRRDSAAPPPVLELGELRIDREAYRVTVSGADVALTALEFKLLVTLLERRERVQTRDALLTDVWGMDTEIETRTIDTHVKRLREKLGRFGDKIQTVRGVGYRLSEVPREEEA